LNKIYDDRKSLPAVDFLRSTLSYLEVDYEIPEKDLERIPETGPFITVSNHPLGAIDGMILMKILIERRPEYKVIANFLLQRFLPWEPYIMPVNPFEARREVKSSLSGVKRALLHLPEGNPLGIFPAGEVSTTKIEKAIVDRPWLPEAIKIIQKAKVPVVPIYFHGRNSKAFYQLAKLSGALRTAKIPSEMLSQHMRDIKVRIGNPISVKTQQTYNDPQEFSDFLRKKTYMLSSGFDKKSLLANIPTQIKIP